MNYKQSKFEDEYKKDPTGHYYGSLVRRLFVLAGIILLINIPIDRELIQFYIVFGVIFALLIILLAAFTSPLNKWAMIGDLVASAVSFIVFEYLAIARQLQIDSFFDYLFLVRQALAIIFIVAVYFSAKTVRGLIIKM